MHGRDGRLKLVPTIALYFEQTCSNLLCSCRVAKVTGSLGQHCKPTFNRLCCGGESIRKFSAFLHSVRGHPHAVQSLLSTSQSCCGLGGCNLIFFYFVFRQVTAISLRAGNTALFLQGKNTHYFERRGNVTIHTHTRPIRSYVSKTG